jgi:hypothetical protein
MFFFISFVLQKKNQFHRGNSRKGNPCVVCEARIFKSFFIFSSSFLI